MNQVNNNSKILKHNFNHVSFLHPQITVLVQDSLHFCHINLLDFQLHKLNLVCFLSVVIDVE